MKTWPPAEEELFHDVAWPVLIVVAVFLMCLGVMGAGP